MNRIGLVFAPDRSGWARIIVPGDADLIRVRFERAADGYAFAVREVFVTSADRVSAGTLKSVPLAQAEALVNDGRAEFYNHIPTGPSLARPWPESLLDPSTGERWWLNSVDQVSVPSPPDLRIDISTGYARPDSFYLAVAERFAYLSTVSRRPANDLAEANGVPGTTVHGWVKEARRRGHLPQPSSARRRGPVVPEGLRRIGSEGDVAR